MKILAIETSCDETAVALLDITGPREKPEIKVLANNLLSQIHIHKDYGGVYPNLAKREHQKNLPPLLEKTLKEASEGGGNSEVVGAPEERVKTDAISAVVADIDYIAVTQGPGLEPALWTGITFAQELGHKWNKPVVPVNHMEGHIYSVLYQDKFSISNSQFSKLELPAVALLVSGGHTELVLVKDFNSLEVIGKTRDDAVGEAFDKVARMLDLPYPGGPKISALADIARKKGYNPPVKFPRPMIHSQDLDFSFSGLKTAVLYFLKSHEINEELKEEVARAFEDAAVETLVGKTKRALNKYPAVKTYVVGGGVSANTYLRSELGKLSIEFPEVEFRFPDYSVTTDNAIMIGIAAYVRLSNSLIEKQDIIARGNLTY